MRKQSAPSHFCKLKPSIWPQQKSQRRPSKFTLTMNRLKERYTRLFITFQIKVMTVNAVGDSVLHNSNSVWLKKCSITTRRLRIILRQPLSISAKSITSEAYRYVQNICAHSKGANQCLIIETSRLTRETIRSTLSCGEHRTASFKST